MYASVYQRQRLCDCIECCKEGRCLIIESFPLFKPQAVPLTPLLLFQYGDPHHPHHNKHQPYGQAGRGHRGGCFSHPQRLEQEDESACSRHQRSHHHHDDGFVEIGPALADCSAGVRVWTQTLTPRVIWKWSFSNCFHGCFTEKGKKRLLPLCLSPLRAFNVWIMETPANEHPQLHNFLLHFSLQSLLKIKAATSQQSYEGVISSVWSIGVCPHDASLTLLPSKPWTHCNSRWPTTPPQTEGGLGWIDRPSPPVDNNIITTDWLATYWSSCSSTTNIAIKM